MSDLNRAVPISFNIGVRLYLSDGMFPLMKEGEWSRPDGVQSVQSPRRLGGYG